LRRPAGYVYEEAASYKSQQTTANRLTVRVRLYLSSSLLSLYHRHTFLFTEYVRRCGNDPAHDNLLEIELSRVPSRFNEPVRAMATNNVEVPIQLIQPRKTRYFESKVDKAQKISGQEQSGLTNNFQDDAVLQESPNYDESPSYDESRLHQTRWSKTTWSGSFTWMQSDDLLTQDRCKGSKSKKQIHRSNSVPICLQRSIY